MIAAIVMIMSVVVTATTAAVTIPRPALPASTCAGIRGNGQNLFAHYGALARQVEEYGAVTCAAGGSSGSITTFFLARLAATCRCSVSPGC